jgi:hypothetical protein
MLHVTQLPTHTRCVWGRMHSPVWRAHLEWWYQHLVCLLSGGCCCYGTRIRDLIGYPIDPGFKSRSRQFLSFFFVFGDSTPINQNSKLYVGRRRTNDRRQGEIQARKRYGQADARRGNHTFRVQMCVTAGRHLRIQANLPEITIHATAPLAGPRATVAKVTEMNNEIGGNDIISVRKSRKPWWAQFSLRLTKVTAFSSRSVFLSHPTTLPTFGVAAV